MNGYEDVIHMYNGILLSHKKEQSWVICKDVDEPRVVVQCSHSDNSERELYINTCMWNLEKRYR